MIVEELVTKLGLEIDEGVLSTLEKFQEMLHHGFEAIGGFAGAATLALTGMSITAANAGNEASRLANKLGMSVEALQEIQGAARLTEVPLEAVAMGLKFLEKNAAMAADGTKEAVDAFAGIKYKDAAGHIKSADELLIAVAEKFDTVKDAAKQTEIAMKIFGRQGLELVPLLKKGSAGIAELREEAVSLGFVMGGEAIEASVAFHEELARVEVALIGLRNTIGVPFIPVFTGMIKALLSTIIFFRKTLVEVSKLLSSSLAPAFKMVTEGIVALRKTGLGEIFKEFASDSKFLQILLLGLAGVMTFLGIQAGIAAAITVAGWVLAAAPFILLAMLLGLVIDEIIGLIDGSETLTGEVQKWAKEFDPTDSPMILFFKSAIRWLDDLGDPKRWDRVRESANNALHDLLGSEKSLKMSGIRGIVQPGQQVPISEEEAQQDWGHRMLRSLGIHNKTQFYAPAPFESAPISSTGLNNNQFSGGQTASGFGDYPTQWIQSQGGPNYSAGPTSSEMPTIHQTNNITINSSNAEDLVSKVREGIDDANRSAYSTIQGGH